jgi:ferrous-iron efflux pump FieF
MTEIPAPSQPISALGSADYSRLVRAASYASVGVAMILIMAKVWAFRVTDSVSLLSSLADSLLDLLASLITFFAVRYALEPADREHRFGHGKSEGVAGLAQSFIVTASALYVGFEAVQRLLNPVPIAQPSVGMVVMLVSIFLTLALVMFQRSVSRRTGSLAISADAAHYKADLATNLVVLLALGADQLFGWFRLDALVGLAIVALILFSVYQIATRALDVLLDRELPEADRHKVTRIATGHPAVMGLHDLRTRSTGSSQFIQFHLELDPKLSLIEAHDISDEVEKLVEAGFPQAEVIIHADPFGVDEKRDLF